MCPHAGCEVSRGGRVKRLFPSGIYVARAHRKQSREEYGGYRQGVRIESAEGGEMSRRAWRLRWKVQKTGSDRMYLMRQIDETNQKIW